MHARLLSVASDEFTSSVSDSCARVRSPGHPAVFATAAGTGQVDLWNLNKNVEVRGTSLLRAGLRRCVPGRFVVTHLAA